MSGEFDKQVEANYRDIKEKLLFTVGQLKMIVGAVNSSEVVPAYQDDMVEVDQIMKQYINQVDNV